MISFCLTKKSILKNYYISKNKLVPIFKNAITTNVENLPDVYKPNGAIFIFNAKEFLKENNFPFKNFYPFIMDKNSSIDIELLVYKYFGDIPALILRKMFIQSQEKESTNNNQINQLLKSFRDISIRLDRIEQALLNG